MDPVLLQGEARAIDGDTLQVGDTRLRLHSIDAPELRETCENSAGEAWACGRRETVELAAAEEKSLKPHHRVLVHGHPPILTSPH